MTQHVPWGNNSRSTTTPEDRRAWDEQERRYPPKTVADLDRETDAQDRAEARRAARAAVREARQKEPMCPHGCGFTEKEKQ